MSYVIKTRNEDEDIYFFRLCKRAGNGKRIPAFRDDIADAYVFDTKDRAYRMMALINAISPKIELELEKLQEAELRGADGYVPLEKTKEAMCSPDFKQRLWAEYEQLNTRRHLLKEYRKGLGTDTLELEIIDEQIAHMHSYMIDLLRRCEFENVDLTEVEKTLNQ